MKPILFNTDMVRAILDNRKTVTRRVVKLKYSNTHLEMFTNKYGTCLIEKQNEEPGVTTIKNPDGTTTHKMLACIEKTPPYRSGDILYVRETYRKNEYPWDNEDYIYKADEHPTDWDIHKWHPSIHMPREAARIFLRVTDVQVERLQDINNDEALKEGCGYFGAVDWVKEPLPDFRDTWDSTVKQKDRALYGWAGNPWVWVIEFERCGKPKGDN